MKTCETNKYDLAICDPPYGKKVNMSGGGRYARYENHFVPLNVAPPESSIQPAPQNCTFVAAEIAPLTVP